MGLQKYRADIEGSPDANGAIMWSAKWMGGPSPALIRNCPTPYGPRTVYIQGEPDTFFSIPAACRYKGKDIRGWVGQDNGNWFFRANGENKTNERDSGSGPTASV